MDQAEKQEQEFWELNIATVSPALRRFRNALEEIPPPGAGCHPALLGVANLAKLAGLGQEDAVAEIYEAVPSGDREVDSREVEEAVRKAYLDSAGPRNAKGRPVLGPESFGQLLALAPRTEPGRVSAAILDQSPVDIPGERAAAANLTLEALFRPEEFVFLGDRKDLGVSTRADIQARGAFGLPFLCPNPFCGEPRKAKSGGLSLRCDAAISRYQCFVLEWDEAPLREQGLAVLALIARGFPVVAVITSGGKSLHVWGAVSGVSTAKEWDANVRSLFWRFFVPLGADPACANPSRLSRMPGHLRGGEKEQRLLFLNPAALRGVQR